MLDHLAQAAAVLLILELMVVIIIFLAISGGLAFGLHWVRGKSGWVYAKIHKYVPLGTRYVHLATSSAAKPFATGSQLMGRLLDNAEEIEKRVSQRRPSPATPPESVGGPASRAGSEPSPTS
jgi:hypothetical protein